MVVLNKWEKIHVQLWTVLLREEVHTQGRVVDINHPFLAFLIEGEHFYESLTYLVLREHFFFYVELGVPSGFVY